MIRRVSSSALDWTVNVSPMTRCDAGLAPRVMRQLRRRGVEIAIGPFPKRDNQPANAIIRDNAGNYIQVLGR